ncbi:MAG TPA: cation:proton antiporter [Candidatus Saccharimonadales bacterium]|nr:cation:proton antiporter [Candidatus Saccharimonadales bacterium]
MEQQIFFQLSIVMVIAAAAALVARLLRQPLVIAYIVAGFLIGPSVLDVIHNQAAFESFSQIGIALLLFIIGLGLNLGTILTTGKPVALAFLSSVICTGGLGFLLSQAMGFSSTESLIMAMALLFSSTIIVVKALSDKKEQSRLYGRVAVGILIAEDVAASLALVFISASGTGDGGVRDALLLVAKGLGLGTILVLVGGYIMPRLGKWFASSQELLYIFAIAWAFGVASAYLYAGFSLEVGALFAGVALASLPYVQAIATKLKPLRDFFLVLFFISLGESLRIDVLHLAILTALAFSVFVIITKSLVFMTSMGLLGYTKQTSFKTGVHLSQISEFSVILVALAATNGLVGDDLVTIATLTALFTIAASTYLMQYDDWLYRRLENVLSIFEKSEVRKEVNELSSYPLVLLGYHQGGSAFIRTFRKMKKPFIVVDYDPDVIETLEKQHVNHLYGDVTELELLDEIGIRHSELIISTIADPETNRLLAEYITRKNDRAVFICHCTKLNDADSLYRAGATYVLMPHYIGDKHIDDFLIHHGTTKQAFARYRHDHLLNLGGTAVKG